MRLFGITITVHVPEITRAVCTPPANLDCRDESAATSWERLAEQIQKAREELPRVRRLRLAPDPDWTPDFLRPDGPRPPRLPLNAQVV